MSFKLLLMYKTSKGPETTILEFECPKAAKVAHDDFVDMVRRETSAGCYARIFPNPPTVRSLFKEMIKANPYGDVREMMNKAKEAIKVMEEKTIEDI